MQTIIPACLIALALAGCATKPKPMAACTTNIEQENLALATVVRERFGEQKYGYNTKIVVPRARDARGAVVLEAYRIYPITLPEPDEQPLGRKLTVVLNPCTLKPVKVFEPA